MSLKHEYLRDTLGLVLDDLQDSVLDSVFDEIDKLVSIAIGREEEALKELDNPAFVAQHNLHPLICSIVKALVKNRMNVDAARQNCGFTIYLGFEGYHLAWCPGSHDEACESKEEHEVQDQHFNSLEDAKAYIEILKKEEPELCKYIDNDVEDFYRDFDYDWNPKYYLKG